MVKLSDRVRALKPSATLAIDAKAKALRNQGVDIINLSAGEPDFDTPEPIKEACIKALKEGFTKYVPTAGIPSLREVICEKVKLDYGLEYDVEEVIVTAGAKQAIFNLLLALVNPGEEVLILSPYWVSYPEMVICAGGIPKIVSSDFSRRFEPTLEDIAKATSPRTVGIILNSPSNPTGLIYSYEFLRDLANFIKTKDLWVISDDIYDKLRFDMKKPENILTVDPSLRDQVCLVNGVSKSYAMTGWRIGWALAPREIISACAKIQGQSTSHATSFAQKGAETALKLPDEVIEVMLKTLIKRSEILTQELNKIPEIEFIPPQGAFYFFVKVSAYYGKVSPTGKRIVNSLSLADYLLEEAKVAIVPGIAFGEDDFIRISFALSEEALIEACKRIGEALSKLS
ncbi:MAG: pyridoxal phosphate-dependent aminotransferase [Caldimicrobium sp.]|nr:pyridoxal phosphate-dependent aminotransferase [Caldimicrobium sp.]MCX7873810.1 pyridoxal phosphate-dependent aminotransferase [Caldimicrobium sp.]MDW8094650.1 pyridoxal phosphate-dependent aminotransferase [Caldimicrobium sp.]